MQAVRPADGLGRHAGAAQRRLHDAGLFALRRTDGRQNLELHAELYHLPKEKVAAADRGSARALRPEGLRRRPAGQPAARHQAAPAARRRRAARAGDSHPRRADLRRRPDRARRLLAHADRPLARRGRDDLRHHPLHERGGALRPHLAHARRPGARGRRAHELVKERGSTSLEDCFVGYLAEAAGIDMSKTVEALRLEAVESRTEQLEPPKRFRLGPAVGLRAARDGRASARSDPARLRRSSARSS